MRTLFLSAAIAVFAPLPVLAADSPAAPVAAAEPEAALPAKIACGDKAVFELHTKDGQRFKVTLLSMDWAGVDYQVKASAEAEERKGRVAWPLLAVADADKLLKAGCDAKKAPESLFAARVLQNLPGGDKEAAKWGALAQKAGASKAQVEALKKEKPLFPPPLVPKRGLLLPAGANPDAWAPETVGSMRAAVAASMEKSNRDLVAVKLRMKSDQNSLFLLYSDLPEAETKKWARRFGDIYEGMASAFGMNPKANIWHGKAVVMLFKSKDEYAAHMKTAYGVDVGGSSGYCVSGSDGSVAISMYQDTDNPDLEYVLYHEFSHGFLSRYQSRIWLKSWANEGLAEYMAMRFTGANHNESWRTQSAIDALKKAGSFEDFFSAQHIQGKHYGVAGDITRMMIECDPKRYGAFIAWLKRGAEAEVALQKSYGLTLEELVAAYAKRIGAKQLKSH